ncbi:hypothetical protein ACFQ4A_07970 [Lentibacillus salinarum]|uniref:Peptidase M16 N-terminal domain-containing protein n=1 Tax=Lentibacillus salinarum TaxID=446820 RepID=A0ABW3ZT67_9BACI
MQTNPGVVVWSVMSGPREDERIHEGLTHLITHLIIKHPARPSQRGVLRF